MINRRDFVKAAAGIGAVAPQVLGANDVIRVAVVGLHGRGRRLIEGFSRLPKVEVAALCDVDESVLGEQAAKLEKGSAKVDRYVDMRRIFDKKDIDAVGFATPNHWHALGSIWACQAGKDVYVEKPCSHTIWEGRKLVEAARKHQRIVQHGTGMRSFSVIREAIQKLRDGVIGKIYMAKGVCYKRRDTIGHTPDEPVPPGIHYDLWLGPAPLRPFSRNRFHYNWHWNWDYGNGDIGNQGAHQMDLARWGLGVKLPDKISSAGGHFLFDDDQQTPNVQIATFEYPSEGKILTFEVRHWITNHEAETGAKADNDIGVLFFGSEGYMVIGEGYRTYLGQKREPGPAGNPLPGDAHFANFIEAVRNRNRENLTAEIEEGHLSTVLSHLANISFRVGRTLRFNTTTEQFIGDSEADKLLRRNYRTPFVVPESV
jgi:predicted dehydrogenase